MRPERDDSSRALHVLRASMHVFTRVDDVAELLTETCRIVVDIDGCVAAWAGIGVPGAFTTVTGVGIEADVAARDLATRQPQLLSLNPPRGDGAVLTLPLIDGRGVLGVFEIHAAPDRPFDSEDAAIIGELAENLAFAIAARMARAELRETESQLQAAVLERERIYRSLAEHLPDLVVRWDRELRRVYVNPAFAHTLGRPAEELTGGTLGEGYSPADRATLAPHIAALARNVREVFETEVGMSTEMMWPLGRGLGTYHLRLVPEYDEHGQIATVLGIGRDITALKRSERELRTLSDHSPDMIARYDRDGRYLFVNRGIERATGKPASEWLGRTAGDVMGVDENGAPDPTFVPFVRLVEAACREGRPLEGELVMPRDGAPHLFDVRLTPELDELGGLESVLLVCRDITDRRALEDRLRQAQKMEAVGQLAGGIAHDFNNMLAVILMQAALAVRADAAPETVRTALATITETTERAAHLTTQLLTFSRRQVARLIEVDLRDIAAKVTNLLRRVLGDQIATEVRLRGALPRVMADPVMIEQVLMNLGLNARDAMPGGGTLVIGVEPADITEEHASQGPGRRPGTHVCLAVSDTGAGIDPADLPRIFEPFFTTKDVGKGTGLGLATVFGIVQQHQGWIEVESTVRRGTTFRIYVPATISTQPREQPPAPAAPPADRGGNETIMVVEDDAAVRRSVRAMLESYGYQVVEAESPTAASALWDAAASPIDLLLTDLIMPGPVTGLQLAEVLVEKQPSLKVVYMTGYGADMATKLLRVPGRTVLQKPFSADALAACVRNAIDEPA